MKFFIHDIESENVHYKIEDLDITRIVREPDGYEETTVYYDTWSRIYEVLREAGKWNLENDEDANFAYNLVFGMGEPSRSPADTLSYLLVERDFDVFPVLEGGWREVLQFMEQLC